MDYKAPEWMSSISFFKEMKKMAKTFYKIPSEYNENALFSQAKKALTLVFKQKKIVLLK